MENQVEESTVKKETVATARRPGHTSGPRPERKLEAREMPWGYGRDRVTAMPVDPERLFCYWEVTDEGIAAARRTLGPSGEKAGLTLRVFDTTGRLFDGTNAHHYFDHRIGRSDRQWFFQVGRPTSECFVEVGVLSEEGYYAKISRSRRVVFPRREPASWSEPEWVTVHASGHMEVARLPPGGPGAGPGGGPGAGAGPGGGPGGPGGEGGRFDQAPLWAMRIPFGEEGWRLVFETEGGERTEWSEHFYEGAPEEFRTYSWEEPSVVTSSWESGPFAVPVEIPGPVKEAWVGKARSFAVAGRTHVVYGPWQVVIRGLGAHRTKRVLGRWQMYRSWTTDERREVRGTPEARRIPGSSDLLFGGASERRWRGSSEERLGGASELHFVGASERLMRGASELAYAGASERLLRGSSERLMRGASEYRFSGSSERLLGGASEYRWSGSSERLLGGASERRWGGASEGRLGGASEGRLGGASEGRLAGPSGPAQPQGAPPSSGPPPTPDARDNPYPTLPAPPAPPKR